LRTRLAAGIVLAAGGALLGAEARRAPELLLSTSSMSFSAPAGGPNPAPQTLTVTNEGDGRLEWTASSDASWLGSTPASGSLRKDESQDLQVRLHVAGLVPGTHQASLTIHDPKASNSPRSVAVTLRVNASAVIGLSPSSLAFSAPLGGPDPAAQVLTVSNSGGAPLAWSLSDDASWLAAAPASGTLAAGASVQVDVDVSVAGLAAGSHSATLTVTGAGASNSPRTVAVALTVNPLPVIALDPTGLSFQAPFGGPNPAGRSLKITNAGGGTLGWSAQPGAAWLGVSPDQGSLAPGASATATVNVDVAGLPDGVHGSSITVSAAGASNTPRTVPVTLTVNAAPRISLNPVSLDFAATSGGPGS
jgi:hypothetical protein